MPVPNRVRVTCCLLVAVGWAATSSGGEDPPGWYAFEPKSDNESESVIGLQEWNSEPAGAHGRILRDRDRLLYNGKEIKLWGTNIGFNNSCPPKDRAEQIVALYRKYGLNALRHHKHLDGPGWQGMQSERSFVAFDLEKFDRFDYFNKLLKDGGIYMLHSPTFGVRFGRDDAERIPYWQELGAFEDRPNARIRANYGAIYLGTELQDLQIEQTVRFLEHRNPYTKLTYAEDPFVFCVELFNEDSALWYGTIGTLLQSPTLRARTARHFTDWLRARYESEDAWRSAWGEESIYRGRGEGENAPPAGLIDFEKLEGELLPETFAEGTVVPWTHPWLADAALKGGTEQAFLTRRILDSLAFLFELQNDFYDRFVTAIRETGYEGEIVTSNWQAGSLVGHLLNLYSDSRTGIVDRHNYYKGGGSGGLQVGKPFNHLSLLAQPGGGNYTVGFQQVDDAVFMLSEWTHEQPNEWYAEGPVTCGAYGWGLQGWDVSYHFLFGGNTRVSDRLGRGTWDGNNPAILTTFPAVSRMVRRMDVAESPETFHLNAHVPSLLEGRMSFRGETVQNRDQKMFSTDQAPIEALAATRIAVRFTDKYMETPAFDLEHYLDGRTVVSTTRQLRWTYGREGEPNSGYFTINAPGTKGFVGFAPGGESFDLGDGFRITPARGFAVVLLTARRPDATLSGGGEVIITATARARNTGMRLNEEGNVILEKGGPPILMEPVRAEIEVPFGDTLDLLDHDGIRATASRPVDGRIVLDGAEDKTPYYRIR